MSEIVTSKAFSIKEAKFEGAVVQLIHDWATAHPDELAALDRQVKAQRRERAYMGDNLAHFAEVPTTLYHLMCAKVNRNWMQRQDIATVFFRHFRVGLLNLNSMPRFDR